MNKREQIMGGGIRVINHTQPVIQSMYAWFKGPTEHFTHMPVQFMVHNMISRYFIIT